MHLVAQSGQDNLGVVELTVERQVLGVAGYVLEHTRGPEQRGVDVVDVCDVRRCAAAGTATPSLVAYSESGMSVVTTRTLV